MATNVPMFTSAMDTPRPITQDEAHALLVALKAARDALAVHAPGWSSDSRTARALRAVEAAIAKAGG